MLPGSADPGRGVRTIEPTLFSYIWKYSKFEQLKLVLITSLLFPIQYLTLEIPKVIINDAIGAESATVSVLGFEISQVGFLGVMCTAFLIVVICQGLLKMRVNTQKGVLAERMLRRFRFDLTTRLFRFPRSYFRRTSQGELVSMVTAESEGLGGMMGDAYSLPLFQGGQMLTILAFLVIQSPWLGLAATALIPLQAWLIPKMQRKINLLARERVKEVRKFSTLIGESADGAVHLRRTGGLRYWRAVISHQLGRLFRIRFEIYQKKFFMKFVNNFITQLTPLMFFSFGGYLTIRGDLTVGALVAALAAHKDLASPWKELLNYYNQIQETAIRYLTIVEKFAPGGMIPADLLESDGEDKQPLSGDIDLKDVHVRGPDGAALLTDITATIPGGSLVGVEAESEEARRAVGDVLTREVFPSSGTLSIGGKDIMKLPQTVINDRIGYASSRPVVFQGSFASNVLMPIKTHPSNPNWDEESLGRRFDPQVEAEKSGNSTDPLSADWIDPSRLGLSDEADIRTRWLELIETLDVNGALLRSALERKVEAEAIPGIAETIGKLRDQVADGLAAGGLDGLCQRFDPDAYSPGLPIAANLFFALPTRPITQDELMGRFDFLELLHKLDLEQDMLILARDVIDLLRRIFGLDGVKHPMFQRLGLDPEVYERCVKLLPAFESDHARTLSEDDLAVLLIVPFQISTEQIGVAFSEELRQRIVGLRPQARELLNSGLNDLFSPIEPGGYIIGLSVLENMLYGKLTDTAGPRIGDIQAIVVDKLRAMNATRQLYGLIFDQPTEIGGSNLTATMLETLDLTRAALKRPDILILDRAMASFENPDRKTGLMRLRSMLPETTFVVLESVIDDQSGFDALYQIKHSQLHSAVMEGTVEDTDQNPVSVDLTRKLELLETCDIFSGLDQRQLQLLAFGARWYSTEAGTLVFSMGDEPVDGAYVIAEGDADLFIPEEDGAETVVATAHPGSLIGELALINKRRRALSLRARTDLRALRIGSKEFLSVIENDIDTALKLLQVVAGYASQSLK